VALELRQEYRRMKILLAALCTLIGAVAFAQSVPNGGTITQGQVWSTGQWTAAWQSKADVANPGFTGVMTLNGVSVPTTASPAFSGTATLNGINIPTTASPVFSGPVTVAQLIGTNPFTFGFGANAIGCSQVTNSTHIPQVMGTFGTPSAVATYSGRDMVGCYMDITAPPAVANVPGTFTTTTFVPTTPFTSPQLAKFKVGMLVNTSDATFYTGTITGWALNGTSLTVSGWFQQGNTAAGQTPSGPNVIVNPNIKIWGMNINAILTSSSQATASAGIELGTIDNSPTASTNLSWGYDSVNLATARANSAFIARGGGGSGGWTYGYHVLGSAEGGPDPSGGFLSTQTTGNVFQDTAIMTGGNFIRSLNFNVNFAGQTDIGNLTSAASSPLVLHSSGHAGGDASLTVSGGTGASDGTLTIVASKITASALLQLPVTTVASLPACAAGNKGALYAVSDATSPTYNATLTGSGAVSVPVYCNGTAWTSH